MIVLNRLGRGVEAKQLANQESKKLTETKTLGTLKTGCLSRLSKRKSKQNDKFCAADPQTAIQTDPKYGETEKSWTTEESKGRKGKENIMPFSSPSELSTKLTSHIPEKRSGVGVHFASQNKVFAASEVDETKTNPSKNKTLWSTFQPGIWLEKLRDGNFKQQFCGMFKATILVFLHEWGGCTVLLQHSILILIQGGTPEADVFNVNLILGGAILATSTTGGLLNSRGSASCRRALFLATSGLTVASLALLSLSLALRCPGQQLLDFQGTTTSSEEEFGECPEGTAFCDDECYDDGAFNPCNPCAANLYFCDNSCWTNPCTTTTTTVSPQNTTMEIVPLTCENSDFPNELLLLAAILASQHLGLNVCTDHKKEHNQHPIICLRNFPTNPFPPPSSAIGEVSSQEYCIFRRDSQQLVREVENSLSQGAVHSLLHLGAWLGEGWLLAERCGGARGEG